MEGTTGTSFRAHMRPDIAAKLMSDISAYQRATRFATGDAKAAIEGVLSVDPNAEIYFNDAHSKSVNVLFEEFPENIKMVIGSAELWDEVLALDDSFDALICIGAHGNPLTTDAVLCHVWSVREVKFNGKSLTETGLDASLAGFYGIPLVAMSGDEATMKHIQGNISPQIAAAVVKKGIGQYSAVSLHPKKAQKIIKNAVMDGLTRRQEIPPLTYKNPVTVEIDFPNQFNAHKVCHFLGDERISATKVQFVADNAKDAYYKFLTRSEFSSPSYNRG